MQVGIAARAKISDQRVRAHPRHVLGLSSRKAGKKLNQTNIAALVANYKAEMRYGEVATKHNLDLSTVTTYLPWVTTTRRGRSMSSVETIRSHCCPRDDSDGDQSETRLSATRATQSRTPSRGSEFRPALRFWCVYSGRSELHELLLQCIHFRLSNLPRLEIVERVLRLAIGLFA